MRVIGVNLTLNPYKAFPTDKNRGIFIFRNRHATAIDYFQFGQPSSSVDGFPVLPGEVVTLDRGDLHQEIYVWSDTVNASNVILIG